MRVWPHREYLTNGVSGFQLTHPWGCDSGGDLLNARILNFNSHTREGVTQSFYLYHQKPGISTHTPVRVWQIRGKRTERGKISTHTPVRVWRVTDYIVKEDVAISTHTPVRVWLHYIPSHGLPSISTHTPVRVWLVGILNHSFLLVFQLTHPWGCDLRSMGTQQHEPTISTHTPVRVWLLGLMKLYVNFIISTHTPVRVWQMSAPQQQTEIHFNSHTREGVTP